MSPLEWVLMGIAAFAIIVAVCAVLVGLHLAKIILAFIEGWR